MSVVDRTVIADLELDRETVFRYAVGLVGLLFLGDLVVGLATGRYSFARVGRYLWNGLMYGLLIGLAGIGLSMTYSILNFANFAHGDYITGGAFIGWGATYLVAGWGVADLGHLLLVAPQRGIGGAQLDIGITTSPVAILAGLFVAAVGTVALVLLIDRLVFRPMRDAGGIPLLIASIGLAFALRYLIVFVYAQRTRGTTNAGAVPDVELALVDGTVPVDAHDLTLVVAALVLMGGVHWLLQSTKLGTAMRAMSDNEDLARVTGISTERVVRFTWIVGGGLSGIAGYLLVLWTGTIDWQFGWLLLLLIFAAVILGGIGSIYGAIVGGLVIGLTKELSLVWLPSGDFDLVAAFGIMILVLLLQPSGLFGGTSTA